MEIPVIFRFIMMKKQIVMLRHGIDFVVWHVHQVLLILEITWTQYTN